MKVGVGIADVMCGMYASSGILTALRHRNMTGAGQHIDLAWVDAQIAWLINEGTNYLTGGALPERRGNGHPNTVPYQAFAVREGHVVIAVGNDGQFKRFADWMGKPEWADNPSFTTNSAGLSHLNELVGLISDALKGGKTDTAIKGLGGIGVPVGPVKT